MRHRWEAATGEGHTVKETLTVEIAHPQEASEMDEISLHAILMTAEHDANLVMDHFLQDPTSLIVSHLDPRHFAVGSDEAEVEATSLTGAAEEISSGETVKSVLRRDGLLETALEIAGTSEGSRGEKMIEGH